MSYVVRPFPAPAPPLRAACRLPHTTPRRARPRVAPRPPRGPRQADFVFGQKKGGNIPPFSPLGTHKLSALRTPACRARPLPGRAQPRMHHPSPARPRFGPRAAPFAQTAPGKVSPSAAPKSFPPLPTKSNAATFLAPLVCFRSYREHAKTAIAGLKDRAGSSLAAIKKFLKLDPSKNRFLNAALASGVKSGFFVKNKGKYKLSPEAKKPAKKKVAKKKKPAKKKKAKKKKPAKKKKAKKKKAPKKKKAKKKKPAKKKKAAKKKAKKKAPKKKAAKKKAAKKK